MDLLGIHETDESQARRESELVDSRDDIGVIHDENSLPRIRSEKIQEIKRTMIQYLARQLQQSKIFS